MAGELPGLLSCVAKNTSLLPLLTTPAPRLSVSAEEGRSDREEERLGSMEPPPAVLEEEQREASEVSSRRISQEELDQEPTLVTSSRLDIGGGGERGVGNGALSILSYTENVLS